MDITVIVYSISFPPSDGFVNSNFLKSAEQTLLKFLNLSMLLLN